MTWCIYKHTSPSNKSYIGMTCQDPYTRWHNGAGYGIDTKFGKAIQKYGWDNFTHEIIETDIQTLDKAKEREKYWIARYDSFKRGYNSTIGGDSVPPDFIVKIPIYQIDKDLKIIAKYDSYLEASEKTGVGNGNICAVINGHQITAGGYYWCAVEDYSEDWTPRPSCQSRPVICVETQKIYRTQTEAAQDMGINHQESISYCCLRQGITAGGYHWAFADEYDENWTPVEAQEKDFSAIKRKVICHETKEVFESTVAAAKKYNTTHHSIGRACRDHRSARQLHFAYLEEYTDAWKPKEDGRKKSCRAIPIICIETRQEYESMTEASRQMNIITSLIARCCKGELETTHGYHFCYKERKKDYDETVADYH